MKWFKSWMGSVALLLVALLAGLVAMWSVRQYLQEQQDTIRAAHEQETVQRVVAAQHLAAGVRVHADHLAVRDYPAGTVDTDSIAPEHYSRVVGMRLRTPVQAGNALLAVHFHERDELAFSQQLRPGRRAMTIPVDEINSVSGLIQSGDLIDIYVSFDEQGRRVTAPLLQSVLVRATGKNVSPDFSPEQGQHYRSLTLDLAPEEALRLVAARQNGRITALLRNPADQEQSQKAMRGELAHVLGIAALESDKPLRKAEILYGHSPWQGQAQQSARLADPMGMIDLPLTVAAPEVSSVRSAGALYE